MRGSPPDAAFAAVVGAGRFVLARAAPRAAARLAAAVPVAAALGPMSPPVPRRHRVAVAACFALLRGQAATASPLDTVAMCGALLDVATSTRELGADTAAAALARLDDAARLARVSYDGEHAELGRELAYLIAMCEGSDVTAVALPSLLSPHGGLVSMAATGRLPDVLAVHEEALQRLAAVLARQRGCRPVASLPRAGLRARWLREVAESLERYAAAVAHHGVESDAAVEARSAAEGLVVSLARSMVGAVLQVELATTAQRTGDRVLLGERAEAGALSAVFAALRPAPPDADGRFPTALAVDAVLGPVRAASGRVPRLPAID